jgi:catechol 2,3-dioxygenase-like lactoylglutathione lyase family enzyme
MLGNTPVVATLAVNDLQRARDFYENKLGLSVVTDFGEGTGVLYAAGDGTHLSIYYRPNHTAPANTVATWTVDDIEAAVDDLTARGIRFEQYDFPGLKTDSRGIAHMGDERGAWFTDPAGNIHGVFQM